MKTSTESPPGGGRLDRFRSEVVSGGSVPDRPAPGPGDDADAPVSPLTAAIAGIVIVGLLAWLAVTNGWMFIFVLGILVSVFLHETGHFVTARMTGMKATQFFLGFGPRLWSFQRGETEYGVRALPLGAFVRIIGMSNIDEVPPEDEARTYRQKSYPRRMLVITAGSMMHLLIAIGLLFTVYAVRGEFQQTPGAEVGSVIAGGAAAAAGIESGDVVLQIDGVAVDGPDELGEQVRAHDPGDTIDVVVARDGAAQTFSATLEENTDASSPTFGSAMLGVSSRSAGAWQEKSFGDAAVSSVTDIFPLAWDSAKGLVQVVNPVNLWNQVTGETEDPATRPTTVVGVTQVSGAIGEQDGIIGVIYLLAALNVFVGVFNMFPLLPLDGGHAAVATYERVRERGGKRYFADVSKLMPFAMGVIVVLLMLFLSGLYLDIARPLR